MPDHTTVAWFPTAFIQSNLSFLDPLPNPQHKLKSYKFLPHPLTETAHLPASPQCVGSMLLSQVPSNSTWFGHRWALAGGVQHGHKQVRTLSASQPSFPSTPNLAPDFQVSSPDTATSSASKAKRNFLQISKNLNWKKTHSCSCDLLIGFR